MKLFPKRGTREREREPTKHTCSILQPPRSFWTSAVQDGPLTSCCTTQNTIPHHAHTPCYHVQLCQVREKLFSLFPCLIDLDCVSSRQELWQRPPPMTGSEGWWLSVSAFCAGCTVSAVEQHSQICGAVKLTRGDLLQTQKDRKRRPHGPVFALRSSSDHKCLDAERWQYYK